MVFREYFAFRIYDDLFYIAIPKSVWIVRGSFVNTISNTIERYLFVWSFKKKQQKSK